MNFHYWRGLSCDVSDIDIAHESSLAVQHFKHSNGIMSDYYPGMQHSNGIMSDCYTGMHFWVIIRHYFIAVFDVYVTVTVTIGRGEQ